QMAAGMVANCLANVARLQESVLKRHGEKSEPAWQKANAAMINKYDMRIRPTIETIAKAVGASAVDAELVCLTFCDNQQREFIKGRKPLDVAQAADILMASLYASVGLQHEN
ncbi:MAG: hypothetical protein HKO07_06725, partial [Pseudomonadales bacterium]|nr:hypothetical protein [Pseudomonadales bacterium]